MIKTINEINKKIGKYNPILKEEFKKTFPKYFLGILANGIQAVFHFWIPAIIGQILDMLLQDSINKEAIMAKAYLLIAVSFFSLFPRMLYRTLFFRVARVSDTYLREQALRHLQYVKPEYYEKEDKGTFLEYLSKELLSIRKFLGNFFFNIGKMFLSPAVMLLFIAIKYNFIISIAILPVLILTTLHIFKLYNELKERIEEGRISDVNLFKVVEQNTSGFTLIKLYNEQENQINKFKSINEKRYETDYKIGIVKNKISNGVNIMYAACFCIAFGLGLILINNNMLTVGALTALISCLTFAISEITSSIEPIIVGLAYFKQATKRFNYFFALDPYNNEGEKLDKINKLQLKNLSYSYDGINNVLENINIEINRGQNIGIIGQVGSGKTTLMNIISGLLEVKDNNLFINDIDINKYSKESIFQNISYSTQKNIILDDSISNNINISKNEELDVKRLSELSDLYSDVMQMDKKFDTVIGEKGNRLSGGQKQRVQIARNLSNIRGINIYDDTLSALDSNTENRVLDSIIEETKKDILIVVSNKVSSMEKLDKVYMLIDGKILASGTHKELLKTNSLYREMYSYEKEGDLVWEK